MLSSELLTSHGFINAFSERSDGSFAMGEAQTRLTLLKSLKAQRATLYETKQVHGTRLVSIVQVDKAAEIAEQEGDAVLSKLPGQLVGIRTADCVPILLASISPKVVVAVHAGWRGAVANIVSVVIEHLRADHGVETSQLLAVIGPHICSCCFEVGGDVMQQMINAAQRLDVEVRSGSKHADLSALVYGQLLKEGLKGEYIENFGACTMCQSDRFFSYRRGDEGRQLSLIGIK